jgi:hypothetical protein
VASACGPAARRPGRRWGPPKGGRGGGDRATSKRAPPDDGSVSDEDEALQQAESTGQPAEAVSARAQLSDAWASPDGTFSVKRYGTPVRMWRNGAWVATDLTPVFNPDGTVVPKASTVAVTFSGGGTGPLLSGLKDGRTLTLSWPTALLHFVNRYN